MRVVLGKLLCALGLVVSGTAGTRADEKADLEKELKRFQGTWSEESVETSGKKLRIDGLKGMTVTFEGDKYAVKKGDDVLEAATIKLDPSKSPHAIDMTMTEGPFKGAVILGIYEINGDTLKICFDPVGKKRPTEFKTGGGTEILVVHKRVKK